MFLDLVTRGECRVSSALIFGESEGVDFEKVEGVDPKKLSDLNKVP